MIENLSTQELNGASKQQLINSLADTLRLTQTGVTGLDLVSYCERDDLVIITFEDGHQRTANIAADSGIAIIRDVCEAIG